MLVISLPFAALGLEDESRTLKLIPRCRTDRKVRRRPCTGRPVNYLTVELVRQGHGSAPEIVEDG
jgi:hypothetical protein